MAGNDVQRPPSFTLGELARLGIVLGIPAENCFL